MFAFLAKVFALHFEEQAFHAGSNYGRLPQFAFKVL